MHSRRDQRSFLLTLMSCLVVFTLFNHSAISAMAQENAEEEAELQKKVAIVIDDFGNNMSGTEEILNLPFPLTIAVMPFLPTTKRDAEWAYQKGHDVFVHLPMEPVRGKKHWLGPGAITADLDDEEIKRRVKAAIDEVPHAVGINNHMGSKITANAHIMRLVLEVVREKGLIYLDSKTSYKSVVSKLAKEMGVPYAENHIFLDDIYSVKHIAKQYRLIEKHLTDHPICIAIGHVGPPGKKTAAVLKSRMPLMEKDVQFVKISQLVDYKVPGVTP